MRASLSLAFSMVLLFLFWPAFSAATCALPSDWSFRDSQDPGTTATLTTLNPLSGKCSGIFTKAANFPDTSGTFTKTDLPSAPRALSVSFQLSPKNMQFTGSTGGERRGRVLDVRRPSSEEGGSLLFQLLVRNENGNYEANLKWVGDDLSPSERAQGRCTSTWFQLDETVNEIELQLTLGEPGVTAGSCAVYLDGGLVQEQTGLNNEDQSFGNARLGLIRGFHPTFSGDIVFDEISIRDDEPSRVTLNNFDGRVLPSTGGIVYNWFDIDPLTTHPADGSPYCPAGDYHVLTSYQGNEAVIQADLNQMVADGQQRISLGVFHRDDFAHGSALHSSVNGLKANDLQDFQSLVNDVVTAGFSEITFIVLHVTTSPLQFDRHDDTWDTPGSRMNESLDINWAVIQDVMDTLYSMNLPIHWTINLHPELIRPYETNVNLNPTQDPSVPYHRFATEYGKRLWSLFTGKYGILHPNGLPNTMGYSMAGSAVQNGDSDFNERIEHSQFIYGAMQPAYFGFSIYSNAADQLDIIDSAMTSVGYSQGIVITESFYNDYQSAQEIRQAVDAGLNRTLFHITQWQWSRGAPCPHHNIAPPFSRRNYEAFGL